MTNVIERAADRRRVAETIVADLDLVRRWQSFGRPVFVGALACNILVDPDIDMEIYCPDLKVEHGFRVLGECALNQRVTKARFANELAGPDNALYWQLRYRQDDGTEWKVLSHSRWQRRVVLERPWQLLLFVGHAPPTECPTQCPQHETLSQCLGCQGLDDAPPAIGGQFLASNRVSGFP